MTWLLNYRYPPVLPLKLSLSSSDYVRLFVCASLHLSVCLLLELRQFIQCLVTTGGRRSGVQAPAWPKGRCEVVPDKQKLPLPSAPKGHASESSQKRPEKLTQTGASLEKALLAAADALLEHAQELDQWDQRYHTFVNNLLEPATRGRMLMRTLLLFRLQRCLVRASDVAV